MSRVRIYELAKELGVENKDVISRAEEIGIDVDGHLSLLEADDVQSIRKLFDKPSSDNVVQTRVRKTVIRRRRTRVTEAEEAAQAAQEAVEETASEEAAEAPEEAASAVGEEAPQQPAEDSTETEEAVAEESASEPEASAETPEEEESKELKIDPEGRPTATQAVVVAPPPPDFKKPVVPAPRSPGHRGGGRGPAPQPNMRDGGPRGPGRFEGRGGPGGPGGPGDGRGEDGRDKRRRSGRRIVDKHQQPWNPRRAMDDDYGRRTRRGPRKKKAAKTELTTPKAIKRVVKIEDQVTVADLAQQMSIKANELIAKLMGMGVMAGLNQILDLDTTTLIAEEFGFTVENLAFDLTDYVPETEDKPEQMEIRPPVVTIMGHVDHGKTSLLDYIRNAKVADGEAGGITQHIGAYSVEQESGQVVFLDTPGHEAFTAMRARGAEVTDVVILVVAADDGVMPQTIEAINHSKAAEVPIIVAVNKIDKENAQPDQVLSQLSEHGLVPEDWGGDTVVVKVSAHTGEGVDQLLELLSIQAELLELQANADKPGKGVVIEAELDKGRGPVATLLVQEGTVRIGEYVVSGKAYGRVRAMTDHVGTKLTEAGPATPVQLLGFSTVPGVSDPFYVVTDEKKARTIADHREHKDRQRQLGHSSRMSLEGLYEQMQAGDVAELNIVLKSDVQGTIEALKKSLAELKHDEVQVKVIHEAVGGISENDINLASASNAIVLGFNVRPETGAKSLAEAEGIEIKIYNVIYEAIDEVKRAMEGLLAPSIEEREVGTAEVRDTFSVPKMGTVAGCYIQSGQVKRNSFIRLYRDNVLVWTGKLASLRRFKDDVREVKEGYECGLGLENYNDIKVGDILECFEEVEVAKTLD